MAKSKPKPAGSDNFLDLIPEITCRWEKTGNDGVDLLVPRFRNRFMKRLALRLGKSEFVRIHLDASGARAWNLIDGNSSILDIGGRIPPAEQQTEEEAIRQLAEFISILARNRFVHLKTQGLNAE